MKSKDTIFDYLTNIMVIWGISVLSLCLFCSIFGESAKEESSIFELGNQGLTVGTILQFLGLAIIISSLRWIFCTDILIKNMSNAIRVILMFVCIIVTVGIMAAVFFWFPVNQVKSWIMFLGCFAVATSISIAVSVVKEKNENMRINEALKRLKGEEE